MAEPKSGWDDQNRRLLLITVVGTLAANLATLVIVFGGIALIKGVEKCAPYVQLSPGSTCSPRDYVPRWALVWWITIGGGAVAAGLIVAAGQVYRALRGTGAMAPPPHRLVGRLWAHWLRGRELSVNEVERFRVAARAVRWVAGFYIAGVVVMWVGLASGLRPG